MDKLKDFKIRFLGRGKHNNCVVLSKVVNRLMEREMLVVKTSMGSCPSACVYMCGVA